MANIVFGTVNSDFLLGSDQETMIFGGDGDDRIIAGGGNDTVVGGNGQDIVDAGLGDDLIVGGNGSDILLAKEGNDILFGGEGNDWLDGDIGDDSLEGGNGKDLLIGGVGNIYVVGTFTDEASFGDITLTSTNYQPGFTNNDVFVTKLDSTGNVLWAKNFGGSFFDEGKDIAVDLEGNIHVSGTYTGSATFDGFILPDTSSPHSAPQLSQKGFY